MKFIQPDFKGENKGHYTPGIISHGMLYISGQLSIDPDTREVPQGDIYEHARLALNNVDRVLKAAGLGRNKVVQVRIFTTDVAYWDAINKVYKEFFGEHKPARVITISPSLHFGCKIEIEAIAETEE